MLHDIDQHISKISGQQNYMESIQQITGDIMWIDMNMWIDKHKNICACDGNICKLLKNICDIKSNYKINEEAIKDFITFANKYEQESLKLNLRGKGFTTKKTKTQERKIVRDGYKPSDLIKTDWIKNIRELEKNINDFIVDVIGKDVTNKSKNIEVIANSNAIAIQAIFAKKPELIDTKFIFDCKVTPDVGKQFMLMHECCKIIINTLMLPMYNVKQKIIDNSDKLTKIFKSNVAKKMLSGNSLELSDIIVMLENFIIAKYRATITGNNEHYMKLFLNVVGDENISQMDGSRFMEIMDSLDLEQMDSKETVYKFATGAKDTIRKIVSGEKLNAEEVIKDVKKLFVDTEKVVEIPNEEKQAIDDTLHDLL